VTPGATYRISAVGRWKDWWIISGPEGYWLPLVPAGNRLRWKRMFVLSGSVGRGSALRFVIGRSREWQAPESLPEDGDRRLYLFPNDWEGMYHNNRMVPAEKGGPLRVSIRRIS
jgi:hypothetical protein